MKSNSKCSPCDVETGRNVCHKLPQHNLVFASPLPTIHSPSSPHLYYYYYTVFVSYQFGNAKAHINKHTLNKFSKKSIGSAITNSKYNKNNVQAKSIVPVEYIKTHFRLYSSVEATLWGSEK